MPFESGANFDPEHPCKNTSGMDCVTGVSDWLGDHRDLSTDIKLAILSNALRDLDAKQTEQRGTEVRSAVAPTVPPAITAEQEPPSPLVMTGRIDNPNGIDLDIAGADLVIRHTDRKDIAVRTDHTDHWNVSEKGVQQTKVETTSTYSFSYLTTTGPSGDLIIQGDGNNINGDQVTSNTFISKRPDRIEIEVPTNYAGDLNLTVNGVGSTSIDSWTGGNVTINSKGIADLTAGPMQQINQFQVNLKAIGSARFGDIDTRVFEGSTTDIGRLSLANVRASDYARIDKTSIGGVTIDRLDAGNFSSSNDGSGNIVVSALNTGIMNLGNRGIGNIDIKDGSADGGQVSDSGIGSVTLHGDFKVQTDETDLGHVHNYNSA